MSYAVDGFTKWTARETWRRGIDFATQEEFYVGTSFTGKTQQEVLEKICEFFGVDKSEIEFDQEDPGRIEIGLLEDEYGICLTEGEFEKFKAGELEAWQAIYIGYLEERKTISWKVDWRLE